MNKTEKEQLRRLVRSKGYLAGRDEVMGELALPSKEELLDRKPSMEDLAIQNVFNSGVKHAFEAIEKKGQLPQKQRAAISTRHQKFPNNRLNHE